MKKYIFLVIISILLIIPIFYIALCIGYKLDILKSFHILEEIYTQIIVYGNKPQSAVIVSLIYGFIPLFVTLVYIYNSRIKESYGYAKYVTTKSDINKIGLNFERGFPLAKFKNETIYFDDSRSCIVISSPGTGKTSAIVIPILLTAPHSMIVTDIKGELENLTAKYRKEILKNEVYIFNPFGDNNTLYFNPFDKSVIEKMSFNEKFSLCKQVASVLFEPQKGQDPHWIENARKLFTFFAMYDITKKGESNLFEIMRYPKKSEEELLTPEYMQLKKDIEEMQEIQLDTLTFFFKQASEEYIIDPIVQDYAREFQRFNQKEFKSVISTYTTKLEVFNDYRVREVVKKMSFRYEDLRKKNITIYQVLKEKDIAVLSPLIRVFTELVGKNLVDEENNKPHERVGFILDEFVRFGKLEYLLELPTLSRSYGLPSVFIAQTEAQIKKYYSLDDLDIIVSACHYRVIFTINDEAMAKRISESIGNLTRSKVSQTAQEDKIFGSKNKSLEGYALMTQQDLMNIPKDEVIITVAGHKAMPLRAKANYYFKNRKLKKYIYKYARDLSILNK